MSTPQANQASLTPFVHQPDLRAQMILPSVPAGHLTMLVDHQGFEPFLYRDEFVVVDPADKEPEAGEFYVIAYKSSLSAGGLHFVICQLRRGWGYLKPDGVLYCTSNPGPETASWERVPYWYANHGRGSTSEGPMFADYLKSKLVGRVVGLFVPTVGDAA